MKRDWEDWSGVDNGEAHAMLYFIWSHKDYKDDGIPSMEWNEISSSNSDEFEYAFTGHYEAWIQEYELFNNWHPAKRTSQEVWNHYFNKS